MGEINNRIGKYEGKKYGEEEIKEAKGDRATLNKLREAIEGRRKEIKGWWNEPYMKFEKDVKEVLKLIDKPIKEIDEQIKGYEERKREEKKEGIDDIYTACMGDRGYERLLPLSKIFNPKWLNIGYALGDIDNEISGIIKKFEKDMEAIKSLKSEYEGQIRDKYIETLDLGVSLGEQKRLEEQKKRLKEAEARSKASRSEAEKERIFQEGLSGAAMRLQSPPELEEEAKEELRFKVFVTKGQKEKLKKFMIENGIEYDRI
jgi:hypothetical protein